MIRRHMMIIVVLAFSVILSACGGKTYTCTDPLGCIEVKSDEAIKIGAALTLSGPDSTTGIDSLRAIEIAIAHQATLLGHQIEIVKADELCEASGGEAAAAILVRDTQITGVIGTNCSSAGVPAAKILSDAGMVLISPSSTAPSLTAPDTHQPGFLRTIYNDKVQGKVVAEFAYNALGIRKMATLHDGAPYSKQLQEVACSVFRQFGGECVAQVEVHFEEMNVAEILKQIAALNPDALYFPLYTADGIAVALGANEAGLGNAVLISSDGLLNSEFMTQTGAVSDGMYFSGPSTLQVTPWFIEEYKTRYGEEPIDVFHTQTYDAAMMLFAAIEKVAVKGSGRIYFIPRQALRDALFATKDMQGLSGTITCSPEGDCAYPNIQIFQNRGGGTIAVYP